MSTSPLEPLFNPPAPGTIVHSERNAYRIGAPLGQGAFGMVYECQDVWDNALVAKVLTPTGTYEEVRRKWLDESQKLVNFRHPHITFVYDVFEHDNTFYIVMERCSGTLEDLWQTPGFQGENWVMPVARCVLQAVQFIHDWGYVHKDLHARNILRALIHDEVSPEKPPILTFKVADVGISRVESEIDHFHTALAQWMLPPEFLWPQEFGSVGKGTDLYHVGLLLLTLVLGYTPSFTLEHLLAGEPRNVAERLKSPFAPAIAHALRRHVVQRPASARELWCELKAAGPPQPPLLPPLLPGSDWPE